ncbi:hypothetical protein [Seleniivibrio woodruffii]|uniref:hypothetical protein n=1 Tax=Seleniivibrio woodruffii TaxID=1078050 RepID=UPI0026EBD300|nr:hypothetical protein [Seleniivibrio woodruffii]
MATIVESRVIDLTKYEDWCLIVLTGVLTTPSMRIGFHSDDFYILRLSEFNNNSVRIQDAIEISCKSFGLNHVYELVTDFDPVLLFIPLMDSSSESLKSALEYFDIALHFINQRYRWSIFKYLQWDRDHGLAVGVVCSSKGLVPIESKKKDFSAIIKPIENDFWAWMISCGCRDQLPEVAFKFFQSSEWRRQATLAGNSTQRFLFNWLAIESMMLAHEYNESAFIRRLCCLVGYPRGADSKKIRDNETLNFVYPCSDGNSKKWVSAIKEMNETRCKIVHQGVSEVNSVFLTSRKLDWFSLILTKMYMLISKCVIEISCNKETKDINIGEFWDKNVLELLYDKEIGILLQYPDDTILEMDWEKVDLNRLI